MVTRSEAFPSKYLKSCDLPTSGKAFKIAKLVLDKVGTDQKEKYVLYFKGEDRQLVLNVTNWDLIAAFCGADSDTWTGKEIILYPTQTSFGGKQVDCIRVRRPRPQQAKPAPAQVKPAKLVEEELDDAILIDDGDPGSQPEDAIDYEYRA